MVRLDKDKLLARLNRQRPAPGFSLRLERDDDGWFLVVSGVGIITGATPTMCLNTFAHEIRAALGIPHG